MNWTDILAEKAELTKTVVSGLGEVERAVLTQLLRFEKRERGKERPNYKQFYRDQLVTRVREP